MWFWKYNSPIMGGSWHRVRSISLDVSPKYSMFGAEKDTWIFWLTAMCGATGQTDTIEMVVDDITLICEKCKEQ